MSMMRITCLLLFFVVAPLPAQDFHQQAVEESLVPIRPGEPGKSPFWNVYANAQGVCANNRHDF